MTKKRFRIGIDCRLLGKKHAGIGRYVENLLLELAHVPDAEQYYWVFVFYNEEQWKEFLKETDDVEFFKSQQIEFSHVMHYSLREQLRMPTIFGRLGLDLLHVPHFNIPLMYNGKLVVTIHDLLWHEYRGTQVTTLPAWKYWTKHTLYKQVVAQAIKKAVKVFVPARAVKKTVEKYFSNTDHKILVTKEGIGHSFVQYSTQHKRELNNLVYVGSLYPHKNIDVVLQALQELPNFSLDLVGSRNVFSQKVKAKVKQMKLEERVRFWGYLSDEQLLALFQKSFALVQPSLFEGFGLTGVEAMAAGLPVLASDIPVFHEIYKERAPFFDPHNSQKLAEQIKALHSDSDLYKKLEGFSREVKSEFSWKAMTQQILDEYQKVLR